MKLITNINNVNVGDFILVYLPKHEATRVYKIIQIDNQKIIKREFIYSSDGGFSKSIMTNNSFNSSYSDHTDLWYLLDEKEINYYLKLAVFK